MEPIINPWIFYLISVMGSLRVFLIIMSLACLTASIILFFVGWHTPYGDKETLEEEQKLRRYSKHLLITFFFMLAINVFVPSKETIYQMIIAKQITPDNLTYFKGEAMELADYIVNQIKVLKN